MTLGTHAAVGMAIASLTPGHPGLAFSVGFLSHFILDSIPHWEYKILSLQQEGNKLSVDMIFGRKFIIDLLRIGADALIGILIGLIIFDSDRAQGGTLLIGAFGAIVPDFLQFVYFKFKKKPLEYLQRFHIFIHTDNELKVKAYIGIAYQFAIFLVVYVIISICKNL